LDGAPVSSPALNSTARHIPRPSSLSRVSYKTSSWVNRERCQGTRYRWRQCGRNRRSKLSRLRALTFTYPLYVKKRAVFVITSVTSVWVLAIAGWMTVAPMQRCLVNPKNQVIQLMDQFRLDPVLDKGQKCPHLGAVSLRDCLTTMRRGHALGDCNTDHDNDCFRQKTAQR
jgi:hypothetical protein